MKILVTGANGFIGKNLCLWLKNAGHEVLPIDIDNVADLASYVAKADYIFHLAGVNRPLTIEEFYDGNTNLTKHLVDVVKQSKKDIPILFASSIQATLDNDYGKSKKQAEDYLLSSGLRVYIYRFSNVFGKWCRPNYNSAVATFCNNIAHDLPIKVNDPKIIVHLVYIDDICKEALGIINGAIKPSTKDINAVKPIYDRTLGEITSLIYSFKESRKSLQAPSMADEFAKKLYATYLSYIPEDQFAYDLATHADNRGSFTEFLKTPSNGQVSVNVGKPGIVKGNHYHNTKNEKFLVVHGTCSIKFRKIGTDKVLEYVVSGDKLQVVDIPTGYTHSITNIGKDDSVTIMWANEPFDPNNPDTYAEPVLNDK